MPSFHTVVVTLGQGLAYIYAFAFGLIALGWVISPLQSGTFGRWRDPMEPLRFIGVAAIACGWFRVAFIPTSAVRWTVACVLTVLWLGLHIATLIELPDPSDAGLTHETKDNASSTP